MKKERILKLIRLNGNDLPWINQPDTVVHLGNTIVNCSNFLSSDVCQKRARYNQRTNELNQEFHYATPETKCKLNTIYNMSFTGSSLWDLFSEEVSSLEKTYSKSIRIMWDIPVNTHIYIIEPISDQVHLKFVLLRRFLNFRRQIEQSSKTVLKFLFKICQNDSRSITGSNLRKIMLLCEKNSIESLEACDLTSLSYDPVPENEAWRIDVLKELLELRSENLNLPGFTSEEVKEMIDYLHIPLSYVVGVSNAF